MTVAPMPTSTLRRLRDVRSTDAGEVGGKAASLGELIAAGVKRPRGRSIAEAGCGSFRHGR